MSKFGLLSILIGLPAFALSTAQMQLPEELEAQSDSIRISGFGGRNKGTFQMPGYSGEFRRAESRLGVLNSLYVSNKGKSSFTLRNAEGDEILSADCEMKKGAVTIDIVTVDPKKMSYRCEFRNGGELLGARLIVGQPKADNMKERFLAKDLRRGESVIFEKHLVIESVHNYKGTKLQSQPPVGYLLRQDGRAVAALELTDVNPTLIVSYEIADELRRSVLATALALAVLRDPADSALEE